MWLLVAPVTITVPRVRVRVFQLRLSPPRDRSHLSWERHQGVPQSPRPAWGQSCRPAGHSPTEHSWSSSRPPGKCTTAPPQLPSPAPPPAFPPADSPRAGPATNLVSPIWCHHRARVHGVGGCSGRGSVLREILIFHGCFCPPGTFLAAFPLTPRVSAARLCCPRGGSIPSHGLSSQRRILGSTVTHGRHLHSHLPLLAPKALSHVSAAGGYLCPSVPAAVLSHLAPALYIALQWPPQPPKR